MIEYDTEVVRCPYCGNWTFEGWIEAPADYCQHLVSDPPAKPSGYSQAAATEHDGFLAQFESARREVAELAKVFPSCFDAQGRPIVAELRLPTKE